MKRGRKLVLFAVAFGLVAAVPALAPPIGSAQVLPAPHQFYGSVTLNGAAVPNGALVEALVNGVTVASATASDGSYVLRVQEPSAGAYAGAAVTFRVGGSFALQTAIFTPFASTSLNLTATSSSTTQPQPSSVPVAAALASIAPMLEGVWHFDSALQRWKVYDPQAPALSDLTSLERANGYLLRVSQDATLTTPAFTYQLVRGLNMIGWQGY